METPQIKIVFDPEKTGIELYTIQVNNLVHAINASAGDVEKLQLFRQDLAYLLNWHLADLISRAKYPELSRQPKNEENPDAGFAEGLPGWVPPFSDTEIHNPKELPS